MREILFRGKRIDNGEWVYGSLVIQNGEHISKTEVAPDEYYIFGKRGEHCLINPSTVGQYTGLTDKNGKKIFEGDIVSTPRYNGVVVYGTGCYCIEHGNNSPAIDIVMNDFDVYIIGNIQDNPELLEVGE